MELCAFIKNRRRPNIISLNNGKMKTGLPPLLLGDAGNNTNFINEHKKLYCITHGM